jgi:hypothetical protein
MEREGSFAVGCFWGILISIPLWIILFGLVALID